MNSNDYRYVELAVRLPDGAFVRNQFVPIHDREMLSSYRRLHGNRDLYESHCRFAAPGRSSDAVCDFLIRIDAVDPDDSRTSALRACDLLTRRLGIELDSYEITYDGEAGFDIAVARPVFNAPACRELLAVWEELAHCVERARIPHLDLDIYRRDHLRRLVNSINSRTGLYVIPVEYRGLADLGMDALRGEADNPGSCDSMAVPTESDKAAFWMCRALEWAGVDGEATDLSDKKHLSFGVGRGRRDPGRRSKPPQEDPHQLLLFGDEFGPGTKTGPVTAAPEEHEHERRRNP